MGAGASRALRDASTQQLSEFVGVLPSEDQQSLREALRHLDGDGGSTPLRTCDPRAVRDLREFFSAQYRQGGAFSHEDYEEGPQLWTWRHKPTGIEVWRDAIDLTYGAGGEVFFHYTNHVAFVNITHTVKEAAEIYASLNISGPHANAWWGQGVYTVPKPPDQWENRFQLLDNNFRNMMARDEREKGREYVEAQYPPRAAFAIPLIIEPANAYDVSVRATPEMVEYGKEPGRNLADKLLNEPGKPPRTCIVLRVGQESVESARSNLLGALRLRGSAADADEDAQLRLGQVLNHRGFYDEAYEMLMVLWKHLQSQLGDEHPKTLKAMYEVAEVELNLGKFTKAKDLHSQCLELRQRTLGEEHPSTFNSLNGLAEANFKMGQHSVAETLLQKCLAAREEFFGPDHPDTMRSQNDLAAVLAAMGRYVAADELYQQCYEARKRTHGPRHPETLTTLNNMAALLKITGKASGAHSITTQVFMERTTTLHSHHPKRLTSMNNLAAVLEDLGKYEEAEELYRKCLEGRTELLGPEHPHTLISMHNLASLLVKRDQHDEAQELYQRCLELERETQGAEHPDTLTCMTSLAALWWKLGRHHEAAELHRSCLKARVAVSPEHPSTLDSMHHLALSLIKLDQRPEAEELLRSCVEKQERALGAEHPERLVSMTYLAALLRKKKENYQEAEALYLQCLDIRARAVEDEDVNADVMTLTLKSNLADLSLKMGKLDAAEALRRQCLCAKFATVGQGHPDTASAFESLTKVLRKMGKETTLEDEFELWSGIVPEEVKP
ncbi:unnamed protein product [Cladocopium goreaui]|uniref:Uncharacterized protein n=1 Tax=Cladocopium goreaui TaxID=2562237 RepID=A0A9P1CWC2_9DINO|nr:unnamed protein product [Cladocopium goreaui]